MAKFRAIAICRSDGAQVMYDKKESDRLSQRRRRAKIREKLLASGQKMRQQHCTMCMSSKHTYALCPLNCR